MNCFVVVVVCMLIVFALGFFGLEDIAVVGMLCEGLLASRRTLAVRIPSVLVSSVATLARCILKSTIPVITTAPC